MKKLILLAAVCLTGCITIPVTQKFPNMPPELMESCKPLAIIEGETTTLSKLMDTVAKNYGTRHDCAAQVEATKKWYSEQKKIFDEANK
jgi:nitrate reductase gamma subunit